MNIRWATGLLIIAAVVAFQTVWADEVQPVKRDKLEIIGTVLYADTNKPVVPGKWFYVVETTQDGSIYQRNHKKLALAGSVTDEKGFLHIVVDRSEFKDREPLFNAERTSYTLVSYPKNNQSLQLARILSEKDRGIYLFGVQDKEFEDAAQNNKTIVLNMGRKFYYCPEAFDSLVKIPVLNADFDSLKFFESGYDLLDISQRVYTSRFKQKETRYINWELTLKYPAPERRVDFDLHFVCKDVNTGEIVANQKMNGYIDSAWTSSHHNNSWGIKTPGAFWKPGVYTLSTYINGNPVAMDFFKVY